MGREGCSARWFLLKARRIFQGLLFSLQGATASVQFLPNAGCSAYRVGGEDHPEMRGGERMARIGRQTSAQRTSVSELAESLVAQLQIMYRQAEAGRLRGLVEIQEALARAQRLQSAIAAGKRYSV